MACWGYYIVLHLKREEDHFEYKQCRAGQMAQWVKELVAKPDDLGPT